jgi:anti-sigma factor RsiW
MNSARIPVDEELEARLAAWLDGELPEAEARALEGLLEEDAELRARVETIRRTLGLIKGRQPQRMPPAEETLAAVQRRIRRKTRGRHYGSRLQNVGFESLGIVAMLVALLLASQTLMFSAAEDLQVEPLRVAVHLAGPVDQALVTSLGAVQVGSPEGCHHWELGPRGDWPAVLSTLAPSLPPAELARVQAAAAAQESQLVLAIYPTTGPGACPGGGDGGR